MCNPSQDRETYPYAYWSEDHGLLMFTDREALLRDIEALRREQAYNASDVEVLERIAADITAAVEALMDGGAR